MLEVIFEARKMIGARKDELNMGFRLMTHLHLSWTCAMRVHRKAPRKFLGAGQGRRDGVHEGAGCAGWGASYGV
jgi:hypothetical protein